MSDESAIADYLAALPPLRQERITRIIDLIHEVAPLAMGSIKFKMPTFEHAGRFVAVASQKNYISVYLASDPALAAQLRMASPGAAGGKACVNYPDRVPIPENAVRESIKQALAAA